MTEYDNPFREARAHFAGAGKFAVCVTLYMVLAYLVM